MRPKGRGLLGLGVRVGVGVGVRVGVRVGGRLVWGGVSVGGRRGSEAGPGGLLLALGARHQLRGQGGRLGGGGWGGLALRGTPFLLLLLLPVPGQHLLLLGHPQVVDDVAQSGQLVAETYTQVHLHEG